MRHGELIGEITAKGGERGFSSCSVLAFSGPRGGSHGPNSSPSAYIDHMLWTLEWRLEELVLVGEEKHVVSAARESVNETVALWGQTAYVMSKPSFCFSSFGPLKTCQSHAKERGVQTGSGFCAVASHQYSTSWKFWYVRPCNLRYWRIDELTDAVDSSALQGTGNKEIT